jgi:hypothetical protein
MRLPCMASIAGRGQQFNGNADANIAYGIGLLENDYTRYGNDAAGRYVGNDQINPTTGRPYNQGAYDHEGTWNRFKNALTSLFSNKDCFQK